MEPILSAIHQTSGSIWFPHVWCIEELLYLNNINLNFFFFKSTFNTVYLSICIVFYLFKDFEISSQSPNSTSASELQSMILKSEVLICNQPTECRRTLTYGVKFWWWPLTKHYLATITFHHLICWTKTSRFHWSQGRFFNIYTGKQWCSTWIDLNTAGLYTGWTGKFADCSKNHEVIIIA